MGWPVLLLTSYSYVITLHSRHSAPSAVQLLHLLPAKTCTRCPKLLQEPILAASFHLAFLLPCRVLNWVPLSLNDD
jgi:hypothetical protein